MENKKDRNKTGYLRWFIAITLFIILFIHLLFIKAKPSIFHFAILVILLILGVADRFKVIKVPGLIELKDKTEAIDKKINKVVNQIKSIQSQGVNVYYNPPQQTETSTTPYQGDEVKKKTRQRLKNKYGNFRENQREV